MFRRILLPISLAVLASTVISGASLADYDLPELIVTPKVTVPGPQEHGADDGSGSLMGRDDQQAHWGGDHRRYHSLRSHVR